MLRAPLAKSLGRWLMIAGVVVAMSLPAGIFLACVGVLDVPADMKPERVRDAVTNIVYGIALLSGGLFGLGWLLERQAPPEKHPPWEIPPTARSSQHAARLLKIAGIVVALLIPLFFALGCLGLVRFPNSWPAQLRYDAIGNTLLALALTAAGLYALGWHWGRAPRDHPGKTAPQPVWKEAPKDDQLPYR